MGEIQVGMCDFLQVRPYMLYNREVRQTRWQNKRLHLLIVEHRNSRNSMTWRANRCSMCYVILCLSFNIIIACLYVGYTEASWTVCRSASLLIILLVQYVTRPPIVSVYCQRTLHQLVPLVFNSALYDDLLRM